MACGRGSAKDKPAQTAERGTRKGDFDPRNLLDFPAETKGLYGKGAMGTKLNPMHPEHSSGTSPILFFLREIANSTLGPKK